MEFENLDCDVNETIFHRIQREMTPWQQYNFPGREAWIPLMGLGEELGELAQACAIVDDHFVRRPDIQEVEDAIGDCIIYMADYCNGMGYDLELINNTLPTIEFRGPVIINYGKLCHSHIKQIQRIRMHEPHKENAILAMRNILGYLRDKNAHYNSRNGKTIEEIAWDIWLKVKQRDWQKNPNKAHEKVKE